MSQIDITHTNKYLPKTRENRRPSTYYRPRAIRKVKQGKIIHPGVYIPLGKSTDMRNHKQIVKNRNIYEDYNSLLAPKEKSAENISDPKPAAKKLKTNEDHLKRRQCFVKLERLPETLSLQGNGTAAKAVNEEKNVHTDSPVPMTDNIPPIMSLLQQPVAPCKQDEQFKCECTTKTI